MLKFDMSSDMVISLACPEYTGEWYYETMSVMHIMDKDVCITFVSTDVHLQTFNREEPLDKYRLVEEPYDPHIVRTRLLIDI